MKYIEKDFPIERLNEIARKEGNAKKPIYQIHKWWARRLGSVFRMILLTSFIEWKELEEEARKRLGIGSSTDLDEEMNALVHEKMEEILWKRFYSKNDFGGKIGLTIREYKDSDGYTGFTKAGTRIPLEKIDEFKRIIASIKPEDLKVNDQESLSEKSE